MAALAGVKRACLSQFADLRSRHRKKFNRRLARGMDFDDFEVESSKSSVDC